MNLQIIFLVLLCVLIAVSSIIAALQLIESVASLSKISNSEFKRRLNFLTTLIAQAWCQYGPSITSKIKSGLFWVIKFMKGGK